MDFLGYAPYLCISILGEKDETLIENRFNYLIFSIMIKITMTPREVLDELKTVSSNFVSADFRKMRTDSFQKSRTTRFRKIRVVR